jgi:hypothetical protein
VYQETARDLFHILPDMYEFQKQMHIAEINRVNEITELKKKQLYDVILIDRTFHDNILYATQNHTYGDVEELDFLQLDPGSKETYDKVVLLTEPTRDSKHEEFDLYNNNEFKEVFNRSISEYYNHCIEKFRNGTVDREKIMDFITNYIKDERI